MPRQRSPLSVLFLTVFIDMVGFGIIIRSCRFYAERFHATPMEIGWLTGIYSGMQIIFTPILGKLSDRFGRRPILMLSIAGTAIGFVLMGMANALPSFHRANNSRHHRWQYLDPASLYRRCHSSRNAFAFDGFDLTAFGLGFTFGPMIGGIMSRISYSAPFFFAGALAAANVALVYDPTRKPVAGASRASA